MQDDQSPKQERAIYTFSLTLIPLLTLNNGVKFSQLAKITKSNLEFELIASMN